MVRVAVLSLVIFEGGVVDEVVEAEEESVAGATRVATGVVTEILGTDETTPHPSETTVVGSVIEIGGIATETLFAADDHPRVLGGPHPAETFEIVIFK